MSEFNSNPATAAEYGYYCRPWLVQLLSVMSLDVVYERAEGDRLWHRSDGQLIEVLDFAGGFGSTLFGHNHPELVAEAQRLLQQQVPIMVQGSCRGGAARLAARLSKYAENDFVTFFTNSGTETIEAAMKHARLEQDRLMFWAVSGAFHGKTLGAIQMTSSYRKPFAIWGPEVRFLDPQNPQDWEHARAEDGDRVAAVFVEPIQGEGGVRPLSVEFIMWLNQTCKDLNIPLVADEIQSGMGRTGSFLASSEIGLNADYICLGKALGGGLAKIGALMIRRERLVKEFSVIHTSTFSEDDFSCGIALKALDLLESDALAARCAATGKQLLSRLKAVQACYPEQIREIRGSGLMIGLELADQSKSLSNVLKMLSQQRYLGWAAAAYLLNIHHIRIAPTLGQPLTLRIQPSAYVADTDLERLVNAIRMLCEAIKLTDAGHLTGFQIGLQSKSIIDWRREQPSRLEDPRTSQRVAFIGHFLSAQDLALCDPSLSPFSEQQLSGYLARISAILGPSVTESVNIKSKTGAEVHLSLIGLALTAQQISKQRQLGHLAWLHDKIEAAVALARDMGCHVVGLGGYTSGITGNCLRIRTKNIALTSGNSLTLGMAVEALKEMAENIGMELCGARIAVVGVPGNIASMAAIMLAPYASELILIQRIGAISRVKSLVECIANINPKTRIEVTDNLYALQRTSLVMTASTAGGGIIKPCHVGTDKMIICDIAVPSDVSIEVLRERPNAVILNGGVVRLPDKEDFSIAGLPLKRGQVFACMAETLLMGLEGMKEHWSYGRITHDGVEQMLVLAAKHGFVLDTVRRQLPVA